MGLKSLEHFFVGARDLEASRRFYVDVLGFTVGPRPPFDFPGYWLYLGESPCVHLGAAGTFAGAGDASTTPVQAGIDTGPLDHVAFRGEDFEGYRARLDAHGIRYRQRDVPASALKQLFVKDLDGVTLEFNFFTGPA